MSDKTSLVLPDLTLMANSPAIDFGVSLTKVAASDSGSGTVLIVEDATYFQDGSCAPSGKIEADWIAVGSVNNVVKISSINYATNTITLEDSITRNANDDVWLYKNSSGDIVLYGSAPDIGAYEFSGEKENAPPIISLVTPVQLQTYKTGDTVHVEVNVVDDQGVAKVEYYIDDDYAGESSDAPFSSDIQNIPGGFHELYAIAYDEQGLSTKSNEVTIVVGDPQPIAITANWYNIPFDTLDGVVTASFTVMPLQDGMNGIVGLTLGEANSFNSTAVIIRFYENGLIDAINGTKYQAVNEIPYNAMKTYRVDITVDLLMVFTVLR